MDFVLPFEKPIQELEARVASLKETAVDMDVNILKEITRLEKKTETLLCKLYSKLTPWEVVQIARHPSRPHTSDYIKHLVTDFVPLAGDRMFAEDYAIIGGIGRFNGQSVVIIGHEKGKDTDERIKRNFGMPRPEGYRKAIRLFELADRFKLPVLTFVDTSGAHVGVDAEERGISQALATCIEKSLSAQVPIVATIIGEGGSGGAVALASANSVLMLEYSIYSVIAPEACSSILWRTRDYAPDAAEALKLTAPALASYGIVDHVIPEPPGAAHRSQMQVIHSTGEVIAEQLAALMQEHSGTMKAQRHERFLRLGQSPLKDKRRAAH